MAKDEPSSNATETSASSRPQTRRTTKNRATTVPQDKSPDSERTAKFELPKSRIQKWRAR